MQKRKNSEPEDLSPNKKMKNDHKIEHQQHIFDTNTPSDYMTGLEYNIQPWKKRIASVEVDRENVHRTFSQVQPFQEQLGHEKTCQCSYCFQPQRMQIASEEVDREIVQRTISQVQPILDDMHLIQERLTKLELNPDQNKMSNELSIKLDYLITKINKIEKYLENNLENNNHTFSFFHPVIDKNQSSKNPVTEKHWPSYIG